MNTKSGGEQLQLLSLTPNSYEYEREPRHSGEWIVSCCWARHQKSDSLIWETKVLRVQQLTIIQQVEAHIMEKKKKKKTHQVWREVNEMKRSGNDQSMCEIGRGYMWSAFLAFFAEFFDFHVWRTDFTSNRVPQIVLHDCLKIENCRGKKGKKRKESGTEFTRYLKTQLQGF